MQTNFYLDFENKFRGKRETIKEQFSSYDKLVEKVVENNSFNRFVDIGCGRGEWVEKWKDKVEDMIGIECDAKMLDVCRSNGLNVIEGNAIDVLSKFKDHSISLVTLFHVIEHLDHKKLIELLEQIERVLTTKGVLIMETPSIDNLIVSTKTFYLDHTHINHINPDGIKFSMEKLGLNFTKYFYIHGGDLQNSSPLKMTRLLNGVAQDLLIVSTKSKSLYEKLFVHDTSIEDEFQIAITTLDAAVEHDLQFEDIFQEQQKFIVHQSNEVNLLKQEISLLKAHLKYPIYLINFLKKIFKWGDPDKPFKISEFIGDLFSDIVAWFKRIFDIDFQKLVADIVPDFIKDSWLGRKLGLSSGGDIEQEMMSDAETKAVIEEQREKGNIKAIGTVDPYGPGSNADYLNRAALEKEVVAGNGGGGTLITTNNVNTQKTVHAQTNVSPVQDQDQVIKSVEVGFF